MVFTWGYHQRKLGSLYSIVREKGIILVVDVRKRPFATKRNPFWSSEQIEKMVKPAGYYLAYYLGNEHRTLPWKKHPLAQIDLDFLKEYLKSGPILFLCVEIDPDRCHRKDVANQLQNQTGCDVEHLGFDSSARVKKCSGKSKVHPGQLSFFK